MDACGRQRDLSIQSPERQSTQAPPPQDEAPSWGLGIGLLCVAVSFFVYLVGSIGLSTVFVALQGSVPKSIWFAMAAYQFLALGVLLSAVVLVPSRHGMSPGTIGWRYPGWKVMSLSALAVIPVFVGVGLLSGLFDILFPHYLHGNTQELLQGGSSRISLRDAVIICAFTAIEVPLVEETLFRGLLFQGAEATFGAALSGARGTFAAALFSGLVFGLLHFEIHTLPILAFLGFSLAYIFSVRRSIFASGIVHAIVNVLAVLETFHISG